MTGPAALRREARHVSIQSLHVTNGDAVVYAWKKAGLLGTHVGWRDALYEGPVLADRPLEALSVLRAQFWAARGCANAIRLNRDYEKRDAIIRRAGTFDEIVLWFEHDLFDQLQILQILAALREPANGAAVVELVQTDHYLGLQSAEELLGLLPKRRSVTALTQAGAQRAWEAFTGDNPTALQAACQAEYPGLPFLRAALYRLCEEYPSVRNGLRRSEQQLLEAVAQGARRKEEIFRRAQAREEAAFESEPLCYARLTDLSAEPAPLLCELEAGYELTVLGRRIVSGEADYLEARPLDRWIGGVRLTTQRHWRWDERSGRLLERSG